MQSWEYTVIVPEAVTSSVALAHGLRVAKSLRPMGNVNRKVTPAEVEHLRSVVGQAFPDGRLVMGSHGDYGGHRAPRDHTISFRIRGPDGRYCSNVVWVHPDRILALTPQSVIGLVRRSNGQ